MLLYNHYTSPLNQLCIANGGYRKYLHRELQPKHNGITNIRRLLLPS
jgi:hypothetical protein